MRTGHKILAAALAFFMGTILLWPLYPFVFPPVGHLRTQNPTVTSFQEYRLRQAGRDGQKRTIVSVWVPYERISPYLIQAVVIAEDDAFWQHRGFDWKGIREALAKDIQKKTLRYGGSSLTQQLAKNLFLSPSKSLLRKYKEAVYTWRLENALTKKRILELYLNVVEWGDRIYGAQAAAKFYFGKNASDLSPEEAALLASILPMPRRYTPASLRRSQYLARRVEEILAVMVKRGIVKPPEEEPEIVVPPPPRDIQID